MKELIDVRECQSEEFCAAFAMRQWVPLGTKATVTHPIISTRYGLNIYYNNTTIPVFDILRWSDYEAIRRDMRRLLLSDIEPLVKEEALSILYSFLSYPAASGQIGDRTYLTPIGEALNINEYFKYVVLQHEPGKGVPYYELSEIKEIYTSLKEQEGEPIMAKRMTNDSKTQTKADTMKVVDIAWFEEVVTKIQTINAELQSKFSRYMSDVGSDAEIVMILSEITSNVFPDHNPDYDHQMDDDDIRPYTTYHKKLYDSNGDKAICIMYEFSIRYHNVDFILTIPVQTIPMIMLPLRSGIDHNDQKAKEVFIYNIGYPAITGLDL